MEIKQSTLPKGIRLINGRYRWEIMVAGKRKSGTAETLEEAIEAREKVKNELHVEKSKPSLSTSTSGRYTPSAEIECQYCPTLQQAIEQMLRADWSEAKSKRTILGNCREALSFYGSEIRLDQINTNAIDAYAAYLREKGNGHATINRKLSTVSKLISRAFEKGVLDRRPYIERQPEPQGRVRFITPEEEEQILNFYEKRGEYRFYHTIRILIDTGMRCGELIKLTIYDIQPEQGAHGVVYLHETKNGTSRSIPLTARAFESLTYLSKTSKDHERLLHEGAFWIGNEWRKVRAKLNKKDDPNFVPHILRHTCCTRLIQKGAPIKKVQLFMGHQSIQTTMRYTHLCPQDIFDLPSLLE